MKTKNYLFSMLSVAFIVAVAMIAFPAFAGTAPGMQGVSCFVTPVNDVVSADIAVVAHPDEDNALTKTGLTPGIRVAKTRVGVFNTVSLSGCNRAEYNHRLPLLEVGWRIVFRSA